MATASTIRGTRVITLIYACIALGVAFAVEGWLISTDYYFYVKAAIIPVLLVWVAWQRSSPWWLWAALFFSWVGDVVIHQTGDVYFMGGVGSFLLAHIFYAFGFYRHRERKPNPRLLVLFCILIYIGLMLGLLLPDAGRMLLPIMVYALVIGTMLLTAVYVAPFSGKKWLVAGAILFIISDSILAINKFTHPFADAGYVIMGTYMLAQWYLVFGSFQLPLKK